MKAIRTIYPQCADYSLDEVFAFSHVVITMERLGSEYLVYSSCNKTGRETTEKFLGLGFRIIKIEIFDERPNSEMSLFQMP
jgi:hypothetical protein